MSAVTTSAAATTVASATVASVAPPLVWCAAAGVAYELGRRRIRRELPPGRVVSAAQVVSFWSGLAVVAIALSPPLDQWADELFAIHMVQHLLLGLVGPLLLVVGAPLRVMARALQVPTRRVVLRSGHRLARLAGVSRVAPTVALAVVGAHVTALAFWHVPAAYDAAERSTALHALEHTSFLVTGLLLWWVVVGVRWDDRSALAIVYLFLAGLPVGALAALLTLAPTPLYTAHVTTAPTWGLSPLEDQQLAGAIMWVPGGIVYLTLATVLFVRWLAAGPAPGERTLAWRA